MMQDYMFKKANRAAFDTVNQKNKRFWFTIKIIVTVIIISVLFLFLNKQGI